MPTSTLSFFGAAGTVTGSCTLLDTGFARVLVDCGLFQGNKSVTRLNDEPFPFEASSVDAVLLTHAHTDHSGLLPKLVRAGFQGEIHATGPTADLLEFMLLDSARIQEREAERANRRRQRRGKATREPLFTVADAEETLRRLRPLERDVWVTPLEGLEARYLNAGHILGSASIEIRYAADGAGAPGGEAAEGSSDGRGDGGGDRGGDGNGGASGPRTMRLLFSGDLGPDEKTFHAEPGGDTGFDYVVCESTYGDRERDDYTLDARRAALRKELTEALGRGGNVVIPCFAVERSQELLHDIGVLLARDEIPPATVFLDSPLASKVTEVFARHAHTLEDVELPEEALFRDPRFRIVESVDESKAIARVTGGAIIVSASGMADAGRVVHHLKNNVWRREATVLFVGYQSPGTTGAHILGGAPDVFLHGKRFRVQATVRRIGNYSAHADRSELIEWIVERAPIAGALFLNHGDDDARAALADALRERGLESEIVLPAFDERFELAAGSPASKGREGARLEPAALDGDWHAEYAELVLDLARRVEAADDDARRALVARMREALDG